MSPEIAHQPVVLHVNDSAAARYLGSRHLRDAGFRVIEATSGREALQAAATPPLPDVVVLDVVLPDIDGFEVCRRIKASAEHAAIKVLHTSAAIPASPRRVMGLQAGGDLYLAQPYEPAELVASVRALARLRQTELALRDRAERLAEADRRKDEFLAMLAHELRNPLAAITTAVALMPPQDEPIVIPSRLRTIIERQTKQLTRLVGDLLDVARVTRGQIDLQVERVDLTELTRRVVANVGEARAEARAVSLRAELPSEPVYVDADPSRLDQVVSNLLDNALKYTPSGGHVVVTLSICDATAGEHAEISVRDSGIGILPSDLDHVFSTFYQVSPGLARSAGGLGLGLALVKRLVELHGGSVAARSEGHGCGSEFVVRIPLSSEVSAPHRISSVPPADTSPRRILVVDDNVDACELLREQLVAWGHDVVCAHDGATAIDRCVGSDMDLALVDIGLPIADGYEVARRVRAMLGDRCPTLVALTGYGGADHKSQSRAAGFDEHLVKPIDMSTLQRVVAEVAREPALVHLSA